MNPRYLYATALGLGALLAACGGGGGGETPAPSPVATVSSATPGTPVLGQPLLFTVSGSNLDAGLTLVSAGCDNFKLGTTAPNVSTANVAYYSCTVTGTGPQQATVARSSDGTLLATVNYDVPVPTVLATVSSATAGTPMYSRPLLFTVNGSDLDTGLTLSSAGCRDFTLGTSAPHVSTPSVAYFTCTVTGLGDQEATVKRSSDNAVLSTLAYTVPVPQVTLNLSNGAAPGSVVVAGNVVITLAPAQAPVTVDNFLAYVNSGFYDATVFHRYAPGFVLQGGGWAAELSPALPVPPPKATNAPIPLEVGVGLSNVRLSVAMARTTVLNSATSQFFFNLVDNDFLDTAAGGYAVFGIITAGAEVIDALPTAPCASYPALLGAGECLPYPNLTVLSARQTR